VQLRALGKLPRKEGGIAMKRIILKVGTGERNPHRFLIDIDEGTGEAQIVNEKAARIDRDRSASLQVQVGAVHKWIDLEVEAA
jgi:hypothetical protein